MKAAVYGRLSAPRVAGHSSYGNISVRASVFAGVETRRNSYALHARPGDIRQILWRGVTIESPLNLSVNFSRVVA